MELHHDFKELLELFNKNKVEYVIVGGYALAFWGAPRYTGDIDFYVNPTRQNAKRILQSLVEFGFGDLGLVEENFILPQKVIQLGLPPHRVDLVTSIDGVDWDTVISTGVQTKFDHIEVLMISKDALISNKLATGRLKDLADVEALQKIKDDLSD